MMSERLVIIKELDGKGSLLFRERRRKSQSMNFSQGTSELFAGVPECTS